MFKYLTIFTFCFILNSSVFAVTGTHKINPSDEERDSKGVLKIYQSNGKRTLGLLFEEGRGLYGLVTNHDFSDLTDPENSLRVKLGKETRTITSTYSIPDENHLVLIQFNKPFTRIASLPHLPEDSIETGEGYLCGHNHQSQSTSSTLSLQESGPIYFSSLNAFSGRADDLHSRKEKGGRLQDYYILFSHHEKTEELSYPPYQHLRINWDQNPIIMTGPLIVPNEVATLDSLVLENGGIPLLDGILQRSLSLSPNSNYIFLVSSDNQIQGIFSKKIPGYRKELVQVTTSPPTEEGYKAVGTHEFDFPTLYNTYKFRVTLYAHPTKSLIASAKPLMVDLVDLSVLYDFAPVLTTHLLEDLTVYFSDRPEQSNIFYPAVKTEQRRGESILEATLNKAQVLTYYYFLPLYGLKDWILSQIELS
jgi:hypothetical protein